MEVHGAHRPQASLHYGTAEPDLAMVVVTQDEDGRGVFGPPDSAFEVLMLANDTNNGLSGFMGITAVDEAPSGTYRLMLQFDPAVPGLLKSWTNLLMQLEVTDSAHGRVGGALVCACHEHPRIYQPDLPHSGGDG